MYDSLVLRGDVFLAKLDPVEGSEQAGTRPVVVVSRDALNQATSVIIVAAITDAANKKRIYPSHVKVPLGAGGLTMDSIVLCEQIRAISKARLRRQLGRFDKATMARLDTALKITLDLA